MGAGAGADSLWLNDGSGRFADDAWRRLPFDRSDAHGAAAGVERLSARLQDCRDMQRECDGGEARAGRSGVRHNSRMNEARGDGSPDQNPNQRGQHDHQPRGLNGPLAEMPEVGIERLGTSECQHNGAERQEYRNAAIHKKLDGI